MASALIIFCVAIAIGILGSMLGIGGGVFLVPILTAILGLPIKIAIGASIISVIGTSTAAGAVYLGRGITNSRLAMVLEVATTLGALAGGFTAIYINPSVLSGIFGVVLLYVAYSMAFGFRVKPKPNQVGILPTSYTDPLTGQNVSYEAHNLGGGMAASFIAGNVSGLLGIGGGVIKVPVMNLIMGMPMRASIATSNFMIGITAAISAIIYFQHGYIDTTVAIPTALGILIGAQIGSRLGGKLRSGSLKKVFSVVLVAFAVIMFIEAFSGA